MMKHFPLPKHKFQLPEAIKIRRDARAREDEPKPIHVCIYGYSNLAKEVYESLRQEELLQVHITTRTVIER